MWHSKDILDFLEAKWCPIRKGTVLMFLAIKWRADTYGSTWVELSRKSHTRFLISEAQCKKIIIDFRNAWIIEKDSTSKVWNTLFYRIVYKVPENIMNFFRSIWRWLKEKTTEMSRRFIKDMNKKIFDRNNSMTFDLAKNICSRLKIPVPTSLVPVDTWDFKHKTVLIELPGTEESHVFNNKIYYKNKYLNLFDYAKSKVSLPTIQLSNIYLTTK